MKHLKLVTIQFWLVGCLGLNLFPAKVLAFDVASKGREPNAAKKTFTPGQSTVEYSVLNAGFTIVKFNQNIFGISVDCGEFALLLETPFVYDAAAGALIIQQDMIQTLKEGCGINLRQGTRLPIRVNGEQGTLVVPANSVVASGDGSGKLRKPSVLNSSFTLHEWHP